MQVAADRIILFSPPYSHEWVSLPEDPVYQAGVKWWPPKWRNGPLLPEGPAKRSLPQACSKISCLNLQRFHIIFVPDTDTEEKMKQFAGISILQSSKT